MTMRKIIKSTRRNSKEITVKSYLLNEPEKHEKSETENMISQSTYW